MWRVIYIASDREEAENLEKKLSSKGFLVDIEEMPEEGFQVRVPESEADDLILDLDEFLQ